MPTVSIALQGSAGAVVVLIVIFILRGDLVTGRWLDRVIASYEQRLAEKDEQARFWREAHDTVKKANDALITSMYQSLEIGKTTMAVTTAIAPSATASPGGQGDPSVVA